MKRTKFLGATILGLVAFYVIFKIVTSNSASESFQSVQHASPAKPASYKPERVFLVHRELKDYSVIVENNLFRPLGWKRDARPPGELTPTPPSDSIVESPPSPPLPLYGLVLTGIVKNGAYWIAIVEDQHTKAGVFLSPGDMLKDARLQDVSPEEITLARGETTVQLALGERIEYGTDGRMMFGTVTKQQQLKEPARNEDSGQSLLERMRERRRNELNQ